MKNNVETLQKLEIIGRKRVKIDQKSEKDCQITSKIWKKRVKTAKNYRKM